MESDAVHSPCAHMLSGIFTVHRHGFRSGVQIFHLYSTQQLDSKSLLCIPLMHRHLDYELYSCITPCNTLIGSLPCRAAPLDWVLS